MAWEKRWAKHYYYKGFKVHGRVYKIYLGGGPASIAGWPKVADPAIEANNLTNDCTVSPMIVFHSLTRW